MHLKTRWNLYDLKAWKSARNDDMLQCRRWSSEANLRASWIDSFLMLMWMPEQRLHRHYVADSLVYECLVNEHVVLGLQIYCTFNGRTQMVFYSSTSGNKIYVLATNSYVTQRVTLSYKYGVRVLGHCWIDLLRMTGSQPWVPSPLKNL